MMRARGPVPIVSTREHGAINLPRPLNTARVRERLEVASRRAGLRVFENRGSNLYALGIVGVIDVGNLIVEILPKSGESDSAADGAEFLGKLLRFLDQRKRPTITQAAISAEGGGLFEMIMLWAVEQAAEHLAGGLPRRYMWTEERSSAVRGRIDLRHLALRRPGKAFELTVRHAPLSENNLIGRTVKWLLSEIARRTLVNRTRNRALALCHALPLVDGSTPRGDLLDSLDLPALEAHWQPLLTLARAMLGRDTPDPARAGELNSIAVLYSLPRLFEEALRRILGQGLGPLGLASTPVNLPLLTSTPGNLIRLKPDFHFVRKDRTGAIVGDAKWKRIYRDDRIVLAEPDAYQITSYLAATRASRGFIISPIDTPRPPVRHRLFYVQGLHRPLMLIGVHLPSLVEANAAGDAARARLCQLVAASDQI